MSSSNFFPGPKKDPEAKSEAKKEVVGDDFLDIPYSPDTTAASITARIQQKSIRDKGLVAIILNVDNLDDDGDHSFSLTEYRIGKKTLENESKAQRFLLNLNFDKTPLTPRRTIQATPTSEEVASPTSAKSPSLLDIPGSPVGSTLTAPSPESPRLEFSRPYPFSKIDPDKLYNYVIIDEKEFPVGNLDKYIDPTQIIKGDAPEAPEKALPLQFRLVPTNNHYFGAEEAQNVKGAGMVKFAKVDGKIKIAYIDDQAGGYFVKLDDPDREKKLASQTHARELLGVAKHFEPFVKDKPASGMKPGQS